MEKMPKISRKLETVVDLPLFDSKRVLYIFDCWGPGQEFLLEWIEMCPP